MLFPATVTPCQVGGHVPLLWECDMEALGHLDSLCAALLSFLPLPSAGIEGSFQLLLAGRKSALPSSYVTELETHQVPHQRAALLQLLRPLPVSV